MRKTFRTRPAPHRGFSSRHLPPPLLLTLAFAALSGCADERSGRVVGDIFLAPDATHEVSLASAPVRLLADSEELDSALARICPARRPSAPPGVARDRAWQERTRILTAQTLRTVRSDARARFTLDSVAPGRYRLWADTVVDSVRWSWLAPVRVRGGDTVRLNLSNANPDGSPFRCAR